MLGQLPVASGRCSTDEHVMRELVFGWPLRARNISSFRALAGMFAVVTKGIQPPPRGLGVPSLAMYLGDSDLVHRPSHALLFAVWTVYARGR